jgi:murein DD-endopeptidase MepM/ murein hydrolase activator NlpD
MAAIVGWAFLIWCAAGVAGVVAREPDASNQTPFILPVRAADVSFRQGGIWPFGARGGDHPEGHPGIDFEALPGTAVLAAADGSVGFVGVAGHYDFHTISIGHRGAGVLFDTFYTGPLKDIRVRKGDQVRAGQIIARYDISQSGGSPQVVGTLHFGISKKAPHAVGEPSSEGEAVCPADYLTPKAQRELNTLFARARYDRQQEFPILCNPCPPSGCR